MTRIKVGDKIKVKGSRGSWPAGTWTCVATHVGKMTEVPRLRSYSEVDAMLDAAAKPPTKRVPVWIVWWEGADGEHGVDRKSSYEEAAEWQWYLSGARCRHVEITGPHYQKVSA